MGRWGELDKKKIVHILDEGLAWLKGNLKDGTIKDEEYAWSQYHELKDILYRDGRDLLSISNAVKFEKRLKTIKRMLEKWK